MADAEAVYEKKSLIVGGIPINLFVERGSTAGGQSSPVKTSADSLPITVVFLLHGRLSHAEGKEVTPLVKGCFEAVRRKKASGEALLSELVIVTLDHRNHGWCKLDALANEAWDKNNPRHAIDMYATQTGTARDVSFLIDFLAPYLYPHGERTIVDWGAIGVSLGGHSTWILLNDEPRITFGVPIIGCADFETLMKFRAEQTFGPGTQLDAPRYPESLCSLVAKRDPASVTKPTSGHVKSPFYGKRVLVLSGGADKLVPFSASASFVDRLREMIGGDGSVRVVVEDGVGHKLTPNATAQASTFVLQALSAPASRM